MLFFVMVCSSRHIQFYREGANRVTIKSQVWNSKITSVISYVEVTLVTLFLKRSKSKCDAFTH